MDFIAIRVRAGGVQVCIIEAAHNITGGFGGKGVDPGRHVGHIHGGKRRVRVAGIIDRSGRDRVGANIEQGQLSSGAGQRSSIAVQFDGHIAHLHAPLDI